MFGLIGQKLSHSFSPAYFAQKFKKLGIAATYSRFELPQIEDVAALLARPELVGLNVTIPYKTSIMPYLNKIDPAAAAVGAVNCLRREAEGWTGYNTDVIGFGQSLDEFLSHAKQPINAALVLGHGGASKAVQVALHIRNIAFTIVSRHPQANQISYEACSPDIIATHPLIINTTPLGMWPNVDSAPDIPYEALDEKHLLFDLVYNPKETVFLQRGKQQGAQTLDGEQMLHLQADAAWQLWQHIYL